MTKRITAFLLAIVLPVALLFGGCGSVPKLTAEEYCDLLEASMTNYGDDMSEMSDILIKGKEYEGDDLLEFFAENKEDVGKICGDITGILDEIEKANAPDEFSEEHEQLRKAVEIERDYMELIQKLFNADDVSAVSDIQDEISAIVEKELSSDGFPITLIAVTGIVRDGMRD